MKTKDFVLAGLITLNLFLLVAFVAVHSSAQPAQSQSQLTAVLDSTALAGSTCDVAGFYRICPVRISANREGVAVIDTLTNQMGFYARLVGKNDFEKLQPPVDLSRAFGHKP